MFREFNVLLLLVFNFDQFSPKIRFRILLVISTFLYFFHISKFGGKPRFEKTELNDFTHCKIHVKQNVFRLLSSNFDFMFYEWDYIKKKK